MSDWVTYIIYDMHEHKFIKYLLHNKHALMNTCINVLVKHSLYNYLECLLLLTLHHAIKLMNAAKARLTKPDFFHRKDKYSTCRSHVIQKSGCLGLPALVLSNQLYIHLLAG